MRFIHAADIHLDSPLRGLKRYEGAPTEALSGATRQAFVRLVNLCLEEAVDFLLLAGDIYDGDWQDYNTGLFFTKQMSRLREANIPVFLIRGNHDAESRITRELRLPENVRSFESKRAHTATLDDLGVAVHGRSFATQAVSENLALTYPAAVSGFFNIGLLHTSADGRPGHQPYAPCAAADLAAKGYQYWALGHVHQREQLASEPWIVFPGNLQGRHVRETGEKGCTVVRVGEDGAARLEHRTLDVVRWSRCAVDASGAADSEDLLNETRSVLEEARAAAGECLLAVRLVFEGASAAHRGLVTKPEAFAAEVRSLANDLGNIWVERVELQTRSQLDLEALAHQCDPVGQLVRHMRELAGDEAALKELAADLHDLKRKLPPELADRIFPEETAVVRAMLGDVEQLLIPRLLDHFEAP